MNTPIWRRRPAADDVAHAGGEVVGLEDAGPDRVVEVVAHVGDAVGPGHHLTLGGGGRGPAPRMVAHAVERLHAEVERREGDVGAVDRVVVARARQERRERLLRGVARQARGRSRGPARSPPPAAGRGSRPGRSPVATCATSTAWVSRVRRWSFSGAMKTWHLPASRRHGRECFMRSRSRSKHSRSGSGASGRRRTPAPTGRVAPGASVAASSASRSSRRRTGAPTSGRRVVVGTADEGGGDHVGHAPRVRRGCDSQPAVVTSATRCSPVRRDPAPRARRPDGRSARGRASTTRSRARSARRTRPTPDRRRAHRRCRA